MLLSTNGQIFLLKTASQLSPNIPVPSQIRCFQVPAELRFKYKTKSETGKEFCKIEVKQFS